MRLPRDGAEYAHLTFTALPVAATIEASLDREAWSPVAFDGDEGLVLLRGPEASTDDGLLVPEEDAILWVRAVGDVETVVRNAGTVSLY